MTGAEFRVNCTPEEWAAYERGMLAQAANDTTAYRIAAFGAIRRAAACARLCDFFADEAEMGPYSEKGLRQREHARVIRQAIRHAIGSEKT